MIASQAVLLLLWLLFTGSVLRYAWRDKSKPRWLNFVAAGVILAINLSALLAVFWADGLLR